jgi:hypothetical protein
LNAPRAALVLLHSGCNAVGDWGGDQVPWIAAERRVAGVHDHLTAVQVLSVREFPSDAVRSIAPLAPIAVSVNCPAPRPASRVVGRNVDHRPEGMPTGGQQTNL